MSNVKVFGVINVKKYKKGLNNKVYETEFYNLITNTGLQLLTSRRAFERINTCYLGTGVQEPLITDTNLTNRVRGTDNTGGINSSGRHDVNTGISQRSHSYYFDFGQLNGNYTEIGFGVSSSGTNPNRNLVSLFSKALIKDENGNPSVLTIMEDEALRIRYTYFFEPNLERITGNLSLSGNLGQQIGYMIQPIGVGELVGYSAGSGADWRGLGGTFVGWGSPHIVGIASEEVANVIKNGNAFTPLPLETGAYFSGDTSWLTNIGSASNSGISLSNSSNWQNVNGPGQQKTDFIIPVGAWNGASGLFGFIYRPWYGTSGNVREVGAQYAVVFDEPIMKTNERRLDFSLLFGFGRL